jgi:hypothetical protein
VNHRWKCSAALLGGTLFLALPFASAAWRRPVWAGLGAALALTLPSYWALALTLRRSNKVFFSAFLGGSLFRLAGLAAAAYFAWRSGAGVAPVALSCVGGLIFLSFIEMHFLRKEVERA